MAGLAYGAAPSQFLSPACRAHRLAPAASSDAEQLAATAGAWLVPSTLNESAVTTAGLDFLDQCHTFTCITSPAAAAWISASVTVFLSADSV